MKSLPKRKINGCRPGQIYGQIWKGCDLLNLAGGYLLTTGILLTVYYGVVL